MSLVITPPKSGSTQKAPTGLQPAVVVDICDRGIQSTKFGDQHQISLIFLTEATDDNGEHFLLSKIYTKSLHPKSNLRSDLDRFRGKPFTEDDLAQGFDLEKLVGQPCMLYLEKRGDFIAVESILPPEDGHLFEGSGSYVRIKDRPAS